MQTNFGQIMRQTAIQYAENEAIVNIEKDRRLTFIELHMLTNKICNMFHQEFQLDFGDVFLTLLENDNMSLFSWWMAKSKATGAWTNYRDSIEEHEKQIDLVKPKLVVMETALLESYYDLLRKRNIEILCMDKPEQQLEGVHYFWEAIEKAGDEEVNIEYDSDTHIFLYRFTGGTTGEPKCAMYTLDNVIAVVNQFYAQEDNFIKREARFLHMAPITHASAAGILPVFFKGGANVTLNIADLGNFCQVVQDEKINVSFMVPTLLYWMVEAGLEKLYDLSSLTDILYGSAPMSPAKLKGLIEAFGNIFMQGYGATEAMPPVIMLRKGDHLISNEDQERRLGSLGRPIAFVEILICDEKGNEVATGEIGEIWIKSEGVIKGYLNNPELTKIEFQDGYWKSGDMAYQDEKGYVFLVDRKKDMIITGGFNVYCTEVENALNTHPAVQQSVVVGIPHEKWGEAVHAEVILNEGETVEEEKLIEACKEIIGKYKVPKSINFVTQVPLSPVGKVLRKDVRKKYWTDKDRNI